MEILSRGDSEVEPQDENVPVEPKTVMPPNLAWKTQVRVVSMKMGNGFEE